MSIWSLEIAQKIPKKYHDSLSYFSSFAQSSVWDAVLLFTCSIQCHRGPTTFRLVWIMLESTFLLRVQSFRVYTTECTAISMLLTFTWQLSCLLGARFSCFPWLTYSRGLKTLCWNQSVMVDLGSFWWFQSAIWSSMKYFSTITEMISHSCLQCTATFWEHSVTLLGWSHLRRDALTETARENMMFVDTVIKSGILWSWWECSSFTLGLASIMKPERNSLVLLNSDSFEHFICYIRCHFVTKISMLVNFEFWILIKVYLIKS